MIGSLNLRGRIVGLVSALAAVNIGVWFWALIAMRAQPALLGIALLAYGLGLRHAVDADHIAAIDNVTRNLMHDGTRPVSVGFFFALGHSTIVIVVALAVATATTRLSQFMGLREVGSFISTSVSALFLLVIAGMNLSIFRSIHQSYRRVRSGGIFRNEDLDMLLNQRGLAARILKPLFALVTKSWHMFPLGLLFGLGFDTATEVAMFGVSASQIANGAPMQTVVVLPLLFAAGMSLLDTADGIVMLGAYEWAFVKPIRKLFYNMIITLVSVIVALLIGGIEALGLIGRRLRGGGMFWNTILALNDNSNRLGFIIIGVFLTAWMVSYGVYRLKKMDGFLSCDSGVSCVIVTRSQEKQGALRKCKTRGRRFHLDTKT
jgi:high-affinity nickel-transport protein